MEDAVFIDRIDFGLLGAQDILKLSVGEVETVDALNHPKFGVQVNSKPCVTCGMTIQNCPGHFGHIRLNSKVLHPLPYMRRTIADFLRLFCHRCSRLLLSEEKIALLGLDHLTGTERVANISLAISKVGTCSYCRIPTPNLRYLPKEGKYYSSYQSTEDGSEVKVALTTEEIEQIFLRISDADLRLLGYNPSRTHPKDLVLSYFPVLPPRARPSVQTENGPCDDDLSSFLSEIIKHNNRLASGQPRDNKRGDSLKGLIFQLWCMMDNSHGRSKLPGDRIRFSLKQRLSGKPGQFRSNALGKRVNFSARTVISPDPTLESDQVGVPEIIAQNVTVPERVTRWNYQHLSGIVTRGEANFVQRGEDRYNLKYCLRTRGTRILHGDRILRSGTAERGVLETRDGSVLLDPSLDPHFQLKEGDLIIRGEKTLPAVLPRSRVFHLELGDIVHRHLRDGDLVTINRQPTLHAGSFMSARVKRLTDSSLGLPESVTPPYNADFDGDEMNLHVPQTQEARAELSNLTSVEANLFTPQSSRPIIGAVQDALLAPYLMTRSFFPIPPEKFYQLLSFVPWWSPEEILERHRHVSRAYNNESSKIWSSRALFSMILPPSLNYQRQNKVLENEPLFEVRRGVVISGAVNKDILGTKRGTLIHVVGKTFSRETAIRLIDATRFISRGFLLYHGFSIRLRDCIPHSLEEIQSVVHRAFLKARTIMETTSKPVLREQQVALTLNAAKEASQRIARDALRPDNCFFPMINSGSKGNIGNVIQITALLGQQNVNGRRIEPQLSGGKRTLSQYSIEECQNPTDEQLERHFESRGFIVHSFFQGLNPRELWHHATGGRMGLIDTAVKTARTGYAQRRGAKRLEDIKSEYDGTVRNATGRIIQLLYGGDGLNPAELVHVNGSDQFCDVRHLVDRLNFEWEVEEEKKAPLLSSVKLPLVSTVKKGKTRKTTTRTKKKSTSSVLSG